jgi:hypothetical protein
MLPGFGRRGTSFLTNACLGSISAKPDSAKRRDSGNGRCRAPARRVHTGHFRTFLACEKSPTQTLAERPLILSHLTAYLEIRALLTPDQIANYQQLRG